MGVSQRPPELVRLIASALLFTGCIYGWSVWIFGYAKAFSKFETLFIGVGLACVFIWVWPRVKGRLI